MNHNLLLTLFDAILVPTFTDWLLDLDLCALDSAVCCKDLRPKFLATLSRCHIVNTDSVVRDDDKQWILLRDMGLKTVVLDYVSTTTLSLLRSDLSRVDAGYCAQLHRLSPNHVTMRELKISLSSIIPNIVMKFGHLVTHIKFDRCCDEAFYSQLVTMCTSLRVIECHSYGECGDGILSLVDARPLESIMRANLRYLVERRHCTQSLCCDLVRVPVMDDTAVCLGEDKYYHVTAVHHRRAMTDDDIALLTPLLRNVQSLCIWKLPVLAKLCASVCRRLTSLNVVNVYCMISDTVQLIQGSGQLRRLSLSNDDCGVVSAGDEILRAVVQHCPELHECRLSKVAVDSDVLSLLFQSCGELRLFECQQKWDTMRVVDFAVAAIGVDRVEFRDTHSSCGGTIERLGRRRNQLSVQCEVTHTMIVDTLRLNPGVSSIALHQVDCLSSDLIDIIVRQCPQLTSIVIDHDRGVDGRHLVGLNVCNSLQSLSMTRVTFPQEVMLLDLLRCMTHLKHLVLWKCGVFSDELVAVLTDSCRDLRRLEIGDSKAVTSKHVISLLTSCKLLCSLTISRCPQVDASILSYIQSPPLREVRLERCDIGDKDVENLKTHCEERENPQLGLFPRKF